MFYKKICLAGQHIVLWHHNDIIIMILSVIDWKWQLEFHLGPFVKQLSEWFSFIVHKLQLGVEKRTTFEPSMKFYYACYSKH